MWYGCLGNLNQVLNVVYCEPSEEESSVMMWMKFYEKCKLANMVRFKLLHRSLVKNV